LEQQRGPQPSEQIAAALARALRLTLDERDHLFRLIGHNAPARLRRSEHISPALMRVLDRLDDTPALVLSDLADTLVQNPLATALLGDQTRHTGLARSAYYRWFTDPAEVPLHYPEEDHPHQSRIQRRVCRPPTSYAHGTVCPEKSASELRGVGHTVVGPTTVRRPYRPGHAARAAHMGRATTSSRGVVVAGVPRSSGIRRFPVLTATAFTVAAVAAVVQYAVPAVVPALQRDPHGLVHGQWWRLVTPLLVQTLGWYQVLTNLVTLALFGLISEWLLGRWRWMILFASGTLGGQVAAYVWHEPGGGDSIAICGLAAGVAIALLAGHVPVPRLAAHAVVYYIVALTGWGFRGIPAAGLGCLAAGVFLHGFRRIRVPDAERVALAGTVACAIALAAARDLHGAALTSGITIMIFVLAAEHIAKRSTRPPTNIEQSTRQSCGTGR
jgi:hypothetical protein